MTSSNRSIFRVTSPLCGEFTGHRWIPLTKASDRSFDVSFNLRLNKHLSKQSRSWWFETPPCSLWRHRNDKNKKSTSQLLTVHRRPLFSTHKGPVLQKAFLCHVKRNCFEIMSAIDDQLPRRPTTFYLLWLKIRVIIILIHLNGKCQRFRKRGILYSIRCDFNNFGLENAGNNTIVTMINKIWHNILGEIWW